MADDQFQRSYRASEPPARGAGKAPSNDPLAELARLIGQTDPFGEFGRDSARRAAAPPADDHTDWNTQPLGTRNTAVPPADPRAEQRSAGNGYYAPRSTPGEPQVDPLQNFGLEGYGRQTYGSAPSAEEPLYSVERETRGYPSDHAEYQQEVQDEEIYDEEFAQQTDGEYYEDMPSPRRRLGVLAIAGVFALAVIGTAGAFGYRALFGSSGSSQPPPVIKADAGPNKVVPASASAQSNKLITERVNDRAQSEKLVSREEQPIDKAANVVLSQGPQQPSALGTGVIGTEPKKVRTIAIHPDQPPDTAAPSVSPLASAAAAAPARPAPAPAAKPSAPLARPVSTMTADAEDNAAPMPPARSAVRQAAPSQSNAPLSLNPDPSARTPAAQTRTAAVAPTQPPPAATSSVGGLGSYVQVSSQRSEAEAQSAFRGLQAKYPDQLGGRQVQVVKVDLGAKGTYYRAMVGPFTNANEASELCSSLKSAGGQCLVQKN